MNDNGFNIHKGVNVSHLFVDAHLPYGDRKSYFNQTDISLIVRFGLDHVRIPVLEERLWKEDDRADEDAFSYLDHVIRLSLKSGLKVILCLHELRTHRFSSMGVVTPRLFLESDAVNGFCRRWEELSRRLKIFPEEHLAYELLNEPLAPEDEQWNQVLRKAYATVRSNEPTRSLLIGSNYFQRPEKLKRLWTPANDRNLIKSFHFYYPELLTHYKADWSSLGKYEGPINYPGRPVPDHRQHLIENLGTSPEALNQPFSKLIMLKILKDASRNGQTPIHCGEFGCHKMAPQLQKNIWYRDIVECFEQLAIPWTHWDWKGNFGILNQEDWKPCGIHKAMNLKTPNSGFPKKSNESILRNTRVRFGHFLSKSPRLYSAYQKCKRKFSISLNRE